MPLRCCSPVDGALPGAGRQGEGEGEDEGNLAGVGEAAASAVDGRSGAWVELNTQRRGQTRMPGGVFGGVRQRVAGGWLGFRLLVAESEFFLAFSPRKGSKQSSRIPNAVVR